MAGFNWGSALKGALGASPYGAVAGSLFSGFTSGFSGGTRTGGFNGSTMGQQPRRRRSKAMFLRKGRLYMGFSQKDVKAAMRRTYHTRSK